MSKEDKSEEMANVLAELAKRKALQKGISEIPGTTTQEDFKGKKGKSEQLPPEQVEVEK